MSKYKSPFKPIKHLVKKHKAQCMLYAFAMAMDVDVTTLIANIGHDGTEVLWPELASPKCFRGFHITEFVYTCFRMDYAIYEFPRNLSLGYSEETEKEIKPNFKIELDAIIRFNRGVFITANHAYAYDGFCIHDPDKEEGKVGSELLISDVDWQVFFGIIKIVWRGFVA